jgi:hypothetical protein
MSIIRFTNKVNKITKINKLLAKLIITRTNILVQVSSYKSQKDF